VEVLQPLTVFCLAYLSYLAADVVGWSGIIALIGMDILHVHCKKRLTINPSPAGMSITKLSLAGNIFVIPGQGEFVK
jgi:hypothetical protein